MKLEELRSKTPDQLKGSLLDLRKESFNLRFQRISGALENTNRVRKVRRTIARIKTILTEQRQGKTVQAQPKSDNRKSKKK